MIYHLLQRPKTVYFLMACFLLSFCLERAAASEIDGNSWPVFSKKKRLSAKKRVRIRKKGQKAVRKRKATRRRKGKRSVSRTSLKTKKHFRYRKKRLKAKKARPAKKSRMTNHEAEMKKKHKVITAKTFHYPNLMTDAAKIGENLFNLNCVACHGKNALGTANGPPLLHDYYRPGHHADLALFAAPLYGVEAHHWKFGDMPKIATVKEKDVHNLIIYIRTLQRANGIY